MRIAYFVHDLTDPAVARRVAMLHAGKAEVIVLGFRRSEVPPSEIDGATAIDLGRTYDGRMLQRAAMVLLRSAWPRAWSGAVDGVDVVMARNLEMLALARHARARHAPHTGLVYESLDIHRLMVGDGVASRAMRALERQWLDTVDLLVVSSPAFLSRHFEPQQGIRAGREVPVLLVENKMLALGGEELPAPAADIPTGPPWRIGWFGMIRCRRSLDLLCALARKRPGLVEIVIRGRPARTEFADFDAQIDGTPGVTFAGPYRADELASMYSNVHFNWAIDYFEAGANSDWLLPNRVYEGGAFAAVPLARKGTETAAWLERLNIGVTLDSPEQNLEALLERLTGEDFAALKSRIRAVPRSTFIARREDCARLTERLLGVRRYAAGLGVRASQSLS